MFNLNYGKTCPKVVAPVGYFVNFNVHQMHWINLSWDIQRVGPDEVLGPLKLSAPLEDHPNSYRRLNLAKRYFVPLMGLNIGEGPS